MSLHSSTTLDTLGQESQPEPLKKKGWFGYSPAIVILIFVLLVAIVPPVYYLIQSSFYTTKFDGAWDQLTFRFYSDLFSNPRFLSNFVTTTIYAVGSSIIAIVVGAALAWIVERTNTPGRGCIFLVSIISLGIPHVLYTVAWLLLLGKTGPVNFLLKLMFDTDQLILNVNSLWGMILIEGLGFVPLSFLLLSSAFRSADASFEEASLVSGAGLMATFRNITFRLSMPAVLALMMLIIIRAFESFEVPALVGLAGGVHVLTTDIYLATQVEVPPNYGQSAAFSIVMLMIVVIMLHYYSRLSRNADRYQTITGKGYRPRVMNLGKWRYFMSAALVFLFLLVIGFPIALIFFASFQPYYSGINTEILQHLTLDNYDGIFEPGLFLDSLSNTFILGIGTATVVAPFTAVCAWLAVRRYRGGVFLDQLATLPLIFPAIVMGVAFLQVFLHIPLPLYGTILSVIIASCVRYMPYGMRYSYTGILRVHTELEEASSISGARQATTFVRIVMPLIAPALVTCWLFVFLLAVRAVSMPILLVGIDSKVIAVTLFDLWENGSVPELAAMGCTWTALMTVISGTFYILARRYGLKTE